MKALVTILYKSGRRDPKPAVIEGDIGLSDSLDPVLGRITRRADLIFLGSSLRTADPLYDVQIVNISMEGFRLRGIEYIAERELAQEWYIRPLT